MHEIGAKWREAEPAAGVPSDRVPRIVVLEPASHLGPCSDVWLGSSKPAWCRASTGVDSGAATSKSVSTCRSPSASGDYNLQWRNLEKYGSRDIDVYLDPPAPVPEGAVAPFHVKLTMDCETGDWNLEVPSDWDCERHGIMVNGSQWRWDPLPRQLVEGCPGWRDSSLLERPPATLRLKHRDIIRFGRTENCSHEALAAMPYYQFIASPNKIERDEKEAARRARAAARAASSSKPAQKQRIERGDESLIPDAGRACRFRTRRSTPCLRRA